MENTKNAMIITIYLFILFQIQRVIKMVGLEVTFTSYIVLRLMDNDFGRAHCTSGIIF